MTTPGGTGTALTVAEQGAVAAPDADPIALIELMTLGAFIYHGPDARRRAPHLRPEHFSQDLYAATFGTILTLLDGGAGVLSPPLVWGALPGAARDAWVTPTTLNDAWDKTPGLGIVPSLAEQVVGAWAMREAEAAVAAARQRFNDGQVTGGALEGLLDQLRQITADAVSDADVWIDARTSVLSTIEEAAARIEAGLSRGLRTGLNCIDLRLGGLFPGDVVILAGRPSAGKTALMRAIAYGAARESPDHVFALYSLEMGHEQLSERVIAELSAETTAPIQNGALRRGGVNAARLRALAPAADNVPANLFIRDNGCASLADVRRNVWAMKRRHKGKLGAVFIDYLQLMVKPSTRGNDAAAWGEVTRGLKQLAMEAGVCIVLLSQLSRAVESRDNKRPMLSDLRDSGAIEQDADVVLFCYREAYYLERAEPKEATPEHREWEIAFESCRNLLEVICAKSRHGQIGIDKQDYDAAHDRITNPLGRW